MKWLDPEFAQKVNQLSTQVRKKASQIVEALLENKAFSKKEAWMIAISQAEAWEKLRKRSGKPRMANLINLRDLRNPNAIYLVPHEVGWAVVKEGRKTPLYVFEEKLKAVKQARNLSKEYHVPLLILRKDGSIQRRIDYSVHPALVSRFKKL